jgi:DNA repair protein RadD
MPTALRPYQESGVEAARAAFGAGARSVLVVAPTGAGKGTIASHVIQAAISKGRHVVFIVHRGEIMGDVGQRLVRDGITDLGFIKAGASRGSRSALVQLCTVQTLTAREQRPQADLLITDEAHHAVASTYREIYGAYPKVPHLGLTATPERADGTALGDVFERMVVVATVPQLQADGWLVPCDVVAPAGAQNELAQDPLAAWLQHAPGRRTIVFCANVPDAQQLAQRFNAAGVPAACVDGATPKAEREGALRALAAGGLQVVTNVYCLTEGVDVPAVEVCMLARGCSSAATFLQMVGRALRPCAATGKSRALLIDLRGVVHEHGLPGEERRFSLHGKAISNAVKLPPLRQCKACGLVFRPAPACLRCGAELPKPEAPAVKETPMVAGGVVVPLATKRARFDALVVQARDRGFKPAWVGVQFKTEFGHWPRWFIPGFARAPRAAQ